MNKYEITYTYRNKERKEVIEANDINAAAKIFFGEKGWCGAVYISGYSYSWDDRGWYQLERYGSNMSIEARKI